MAEYLIKKDSDEQWVVTPDGSTIYVACNDGFVRSYDAATGQLMDEIDVGADLDSITLTPDGSYIVVALAGVFDEFGSGSDYTANARLALIDPGSDPYYGGPMVEFYDVPVSGDDRGIADVSVSDTYEVLVSLHSVSAVSSSLVKLDLSTATVSPVTSVEGDGTALSLTQSGDYGMTLVGELGQEDGEYSLMLGDYTFTRNDYYSSGAFDFNTGVEAVSGNDFDGFIAVYANEKLMVFDKEFYHLGTIAHNDGISGDIAALAFGADGSTLYALDNLAGTITSYSIAISEFGPEFTVTGSVALNELAVEVLPYGIEMAISPDGSQALLNTTIGLVSVDLGAGSGGGTGEVTQIIGTDGDDYLEGTLGADEFYGLRGNDTYRVDNAGDIVFEEAEAGTDRVMTTLTSYVLPDNVEDLFVIDGADYADTWDLTGNALANAMYFDLVAYDYFALTASAGGGDDIIDAGGLEAQYGSYASWTVTLSGEEGADYLVGSADGDNTLYGGADSDHLIVSGDGYNVLDGGEGADIMDAGAATGYAVFHVDDTDDVVIPGMGYDDWSGQYRNYLEVSAEYYEAPDGIYDITFTGSGIAQIVVGTDGLNHFRRMDSNDTAIGGGGNDYYYVSYANPTIIEEADGGYDRISYIGSMAFYMPLNVEQAYVSGSGGTIYGNEQDNYLITQGGTLYGGLGDDTYSAWETGTIVEYAGEGLDTVTVDYSYTLLEHFENLSWRDNSSSNGFTLTGNAADNVITGSNGNERLYGLDGADILIADVVGADRHATYHAHDTLYGGTGNDELRAVYGNDTLYGEGGWDTLFSGEGNDTLDGGSGTDTASYAHAAAGVTVDLGIQGVTQDTLGAGKDKLVSVERLSGSAFDDTLIADDFAAVIRGGGGNDRVFGGARSDFLYGEDGGDTLYGGNGWDKLYGGNGNDTLHGGNGGDRFNGGAGNDTVHGGAGADRAYLGADADIAYGGLDDDFLSGQGGDDYLLGEDGNDRLVGGAGMDELEGGAGHDVLNGGGAADILIGGDGDDVLIGSWGSDRMAGGVGADTFVFDDGHTSRAEDYADYIEDFSQAEGDLIDLSTIDAIAGGGDDGFVFVGSSVFSGNAGELRVSFVNPGEEFYTWIEGDIDGDGVADFVICLNGHIDLTASDFML